MRVLENLGYNIYMETKNTALIVETFMGFMLVIIIAIPMTMLALSYFGILTP